MDFQHFKGLLPLSMQVAGESSMLMPSKMYRCDFSSYYSLRKKPRNGGGRGRNGRFSGKICDLDQRLCPFSCRNPMYLELTHIYFYTSGGIDVTHLFLFLILFLFS